MLNGISRTDANAYEPVEDWLMVALIRVNRLPENSKDDKALNGAARKLLRSIEAEHVIAPGVWRAAPGHIHLKFKFGQRSVEFVVTGPDDYHALRSSPCESWPPKSCRGWPGEFARAEIRWVFPSSYMTFDQGMFATMRERP